MAARQSLSKGLLLLILTSGAASLRAEVKEMRTYQIHEAFDPEAPFATAVTRDQSLLLFSAKRDGKWRLTRIQNLLDPSPVEQTIDVPGVAIPEEGKRGSVFWPELFATPDAKFVVAVVVIDFASSTVISVIDQHTLGVLTTVHQQAAPLSQHYVDRAGRFVSGEIGYGDTFSPKPGQISSRQDVELRFFTLPAVAPSGECSFYETWKNNRRTLHDQSCGRSLRTLLAGLVDRIGLPYDADAVHPESCQLSDVARDGRFLAAYCEDRPGTTVFTKSGALVGRVEETASATAGFASLNGRDYFLVIEGGTQLKVYQITEPHP